MMVKRERRYQQILNILQAEKPPTQFMLRHLMQRRYGTDITRRQLDFDLRALDVKLPTGHEYGSLRARTKGGDDSVKRVGADLTCGDGTGQGQKLFGVALGAKPKINRV